MSSIRSRVLVLSCTGGKPAGAVWACSRQTHDKRSHEGKQVFLPRRLSLRDANPGSTVCRAERKMLHIRCCART